MFSRDEPVRRILSSFVVMATVAIAARPAAAQTAGSSSAQKWDVDVHVGTLRPSKTVAGSGQLPAAGATFVVQGNPPSPLLSRQVPSWYFGDGALLFNQASAFINASGITPLDAALTTFGGARKQGQTFGVRIGRRIGARYGLEIGVESSDTPLTLSDTAAAAFEASRATFVSGWNSLIATEQARIVNQAAITNPKVTSVLDAAHDSGRQYTVTLAAKIRIVTHGPVIPYVVAGGGAVLSPGSEASASLTGHYEFMNFGVPKSETDNLSVKYKEKPIDSVFIYGAGVDGALGRRAGWRVDVRAISRKNSDVTTIQTFADRAIGFPPNQNAFAVFTNPAIQFSNNPNLPSSLNGFLDNTDTFRGTGRTVQTSLTAGVFFRY